MFNTTLCYIEKDGAYLMIHRVKKKNDMNQDKWLGVGGHFEPGETPEQCLLREAFEETGFTLTQYRYRGIVHFQSDAYPHEDMHLFTATEFSGTIKEECDEGELRWIEKSELLKLPIWEGDKIFLRLIESEKRFFSLKLLYDKDSRFLGHTLEY